MRSMTCLLGGFAFMLTCVSSAEVFTVKLHGSGDYTTIQAAIDAAVDGDEVVVADGTYTGDGNRDINFLGKAITVCSKNGPDKCIIDCEGTEEEPHRGFNFIKDESSTSILDGLQIINGYGLLEDPDANGSYFSYGGAIYCKDSSPSIKNCVFIGNTSDSYAGGVYYFNSNSTIENCIFNDNIARQGGGLYFQKSYSTIINCTFNSNAAEIASGGGLFCTETILIITNCTFSDNICDDYGGGLFCRGERAIITDCTFINNESYYDGGGVSCWSKNSVITDCVFRGNYTVGYNGGGGLYQMGYPGIIKDCTFTNNSARYHGGGLCCEWANSTISNCTFSGNIAKEGGGMTFDYSNSKVKTCSFTGNKAYEEGGGIECYGSDPKITNCLFSGNYANYTGGFADLYKSDPTMTNCIMWDNTPEQISISFYSFPIVNYCDIQGGWEGQSNIDADPEFVKMGCWDDNGTPEDQEDDFWIEGDYHLQWNSPCIDAGKSGSVSGPDEVDIDCEPRVMGITVDIGVDEVGPKQADFTRDGIINTDDFSVLSNSWQTTPVDANWYILSDLRKDGLIDLSDLAVFVEDWLWEADWH